MKKKPVLVIEKNFGKRLKDGNLQKIEITLTIFSNSERSEQLLKWNTF